MYQERFVSSIDKEMLQTARKQFCLDTCLEWQQYLEHPNQKIFIQKTQYATGTSFPAGEGARCYEGKDSFFKAIMCMGQLFLSVDEQIYDWAVEQFGACAPEWFCEYGNLRKIDEKLGEYGREIADTHVYYLPAAIEKEEVTEGDCLRTEKEENPNLQWFHQQEILRFQEKNRFTSAICFSHTQPDVLAVAAIKGTVECTSQAHFGDSGGRGKCFDQTALGVSVDCRKCFDQEAMAGMAGASEDGAYLWQIGINVVPECAGKGLAAELVRSLKDEIIRRGKVPFYGTSESHTISQTVALKAGFVPAWTEIYVCRRKESC